LSIKGIDGAQQRPDALWINDCGTVIDLGRSQCTAQIH
jgi:hypothetical protein